MGPGVGDIRMRKGVLAVGEKAKRKPDPEGEGDATPGRRPSGAGLPRCNPSLGAGPVAHPLPHLSEQDAARIAHLLADERAELEDQRARRTPDQPARTSQLPPSRPLSLPAQRPDVSGAPRRFVPPPWRRLAEPSWHALGTMAGLPPDGNGGARSGVSLADRPAGDPVTETEPAWPRPAQPGRTRPRPTRRRRRRPTLRSSPCSRHSRSCKPPGTRQPPTFTAGCSSAILSFASCSRPG